ncbi:MAG: glycosyltransferase [Clostridia bacterium]|nr:glycosyltransferase [Clostridia bacterium]
MNIAFFTDSYTPYVSGVVRSVETFRRHLEALGHRVMIFAPAYPGAASGPGGVYRFRSIPAPSHPGFHLAVPISPRLGDCLRCAGCQVVHVHSPFLMGTLGLVSGRSLGLPVVFTYHTFYHLYAHYVPLPPTLVAAAVRRWVRGFCNRCDTVVAPSRSAADFLATSGVRVPLAVVPTGIEWSRFAAAAGGHPLPAGWPSARPVSLYAGRLAREKGVDFLLQAFAEAVKQGAPGQLVLVGDGPEAPALRAVARRLGLGDRAVFVGPVPFDAMPQVYAAADLMVFASATDTQGLVLVEAMAGACPVLAAEGPGVTDVVEDGVNGRVVPRRVEVFASTWTSLLSDAALRRTLGEGARRTARRFAAEDMARRLAGVYETLVAGRRRALVG